MVHAYVMIKTATGSSEGILDDVRDLPGISEAHIVAGDFDIVAEVEVDDVYSVLHAASSELQALDGVVETRTYFSLE